MMKNITLFVFMVFVAAGHIPAQNGVELTLDKAIEIAITNSYRIKILEMDIEASLRRQDAYKAGLNTQMYMNLRSPDLQNLLVYKWNSNLNRDEIVRQNSRLWQADFSVKQPLIFFGYPTNGALSLNYKVYRYLQIDDEERFIDYYNRLYLKFEQPFFLPNKLKNDLEEAELDVQNIQYEYLAERVDFIEDIAEDYFELLEVVYISKVYQQELSYAKQIRDIIEERIYSENIQTAELQQVELELANIQDNLLRNKSELRRRMQELKQTLRIPQQDSIFVDPNIIIVPIKVNLEEAIELGFKHNPELKKLQILRHKSKIDIENEKGKNAFNMSLEMTFGLEKKDEYVRQIWSNHDYSNSITINAYLPIWDGGQRENRVQAELIDHRKREMQIEQEREEIGQSIVTAYTNVNEFQQRLLNMKKSRQLALDIMQTNIQQYSDGEIPLASLLQMLDRYHDTEESFIDIYVSYREAILDLMTETYYDFEMDESLIEQLNNARNGAL